MNKEDKKTVTITFRQELEKFAQDVNKLISNSSLSSQREFLEKIAHDVNSLYASAIRVQQQQDEEIEEIGSIVQNIFVQPIAIQQHRQVTILKAVESFSGEKGEETDLSYIMKEYVKHPETTKSFLRELELLTDDLNDILRKIA